CYYISGSPPCWTVMLALEAKGLAYEARRLDNAKGEQKGEAFLAVNPRGTVPVLVCDGLVVRETNAILAFLDAFEPEPPLFGSNPPHTAAIWQMVEETDPLLREPIGSVTRPIFRGRAAEMRDQIDVAIAQVRDALDELEATLAGMSYLVGEALSAADLAVYPAIMQLMRGATREGAETLDLQVAPLAQHYPGIAAWAGRVETLPGHERAYPPHWR
ncbi:MAG: glutathione S-transferase family protein, partial [Alphaproteobacteria bacterium]